MNTNLGEGKPRRYMRFSLGMLMALMACICCYLAGDLRGHRRGTAEMLNKLSPYTKTYYVDDLVIDVDTMDPNQLAAGVAANFDRLMKKIVQNCSPGTWEEAGGAGRISPFPLNHSLIISENHYVHEEISDYLKQMRLAKFGPNYQYTLGATAQAVAQNIAARAATITSTKTYYVDDLVIDADSGKADYDTLMVQIVELCSPDTWEEAGGPGRISPFPLNHSLIVNAAGPVHKQIAELLTKLRNEKFGSGYQYTPGVAAQAADTKSSIGVDR